MQRIDKRAIEKFGIPAAVLMENAGRSVAQEVKKQIGKISSPQVAIFSGKGNNGGDGFVVARYLDNWGIKTNVFLYSGEGKISSPADIFLSVIKKLKIPVIEINDKNWSSSRERLKKFDIIVDALLGTGTKGRIEGLMAAIIEEINRQNKVTISVDIPSGLDGDSGKVLGHCIRADMTVTIAFPKKGFFINEGEKKCGKIIVADIGIPRQRFR